MQYKIPVQIENEDPIFLWLGLKQLAIMVVWGWIWYNIFKALVDSLWPEVAAIPSVIVFVIAFAIAKFRIAWMTFLNFIYSFIRFKVNLEERKWIKWVDSFQAIDIWFITNVDKKSNNEIDVESKIEKINKMWEQISKI